MKEEFNETRNLMERAVEVVLAQGVLRRDLDGNAIADLRERLIALGDAMLVDGLGGISQSVRLKRFIKSQR